ncbi:hypothetical protein [Plantactinospora sp. B24E8]|uniref:hypothetical protein n=1 Tax=Plantactinospora sp. B24E8 TaxID=3153567 RepID=UPI00325DC8FD
MPSKPLPLFRLASAAVEMGGPLTAEFEASYVGADGPGSLFLDQLDEVRPSATFEMLDLAYFVLVHGRVSIVTMNDPASAATDPGYAAALDTAERLLGFRLERFLGATPGEPANGADFKRIATMHAFGDVWPRTEHLVFCLVNS